ncbi:MAG TPA: MarR family transcriptional regulator [Gaiellales bacterium]|nr:MarR family transcriptional regulator [Gaiellales bacterium]
MTSRAQAPPRPPALRAVRRVDRLAQAAADRIAREHGLTMQQWELLTRLRHAGGELDLRELCCNIGVAPPTLSALVDAAEERGWIRRVPHPGDRRRRRVELTAAGERALQRAPHLGHEVGRRMTAGFSADEREQLAVLLERCAANLEVRR